MDIFFYADFSGLFPRNVLYYNTRQSSTLFSGNLMERVTDLADPNRCQGPSVDGQCRNKAQYGSKFCIKHGGGNSNLQEIEDQRGFLLAKADDKIRLAQLSDGLEPVKELRDVIALQHILIERRYNVIKDDNDLLQACGPLSQMIVSMEKLISSAHKIEQNLGELLSRNAVLALARAMCQIVVEELEGIENYEFIVDRITQRLIDTIRVADNSTKADIAIPDLPTLDSDQ